MYSVKLKMMCYILITNSFLMEWRGIWQIYTEFYTLLNLLEFNLIGEKLSWNVTWKWVIVQELNALAQEYVWNEFQFQSPAERPRR